MVLPMGFGIVMGILLLNAYGKYVPRRRVIEGGLIALGIGLLLLSLAGQISQFLSSAEASSDLLDLSAVTSRLGIVVVLAFFAGIAYGFVAIPSQTQLQEELPEDVRGRVFGVLNMLVSIASFLPIIIVGPFSDLVGTTVVILAVATSILIAGIASVVLRGPLRPEESEAVADPHAVDPIAAALGADRPTWYEVEPKDGVRPRNAGGGRCGRPRSGLTACHASRSSSPAGRSRCSTTRWPAATCRRSTEQRSSPGRQASTRSPRSRRSTSGSPRPVTSRSRR